MRRAVMVGLAVAVFAAGCGDGASTTASGGEVRTVLVDYQHDEFASAFLRYYPRKVTVRQGDKVRFKQTWTGEPHSVTMGRVVDDVLEHGDLFAKYNSEEEARADGVSEEVLQKVSQGFTKLPPMGEEGYEVYQPGAQPCYIRDYDDVPAYQGDDDELNPDADCPPGAKRQPPFDGRFGLYNSGFIPYTGKGSNTFEVPVATDAEPGTYRYFCNLHWISMSGEIEIVEKGADIPSQSEVTKQARREIDKDAKVALQRVREAREAKPGGKIGDLELPLAGREADEDHAVIINEFLPKNARAKVGEPVTWTFDGATHTVSFNVPKYFPIMTVAEDGTVTFNDKAHQPVGFNVPPRDGQGHGDGEPPEGGGPERPRSRTVDVGRWDGRGGFRSSGALDPGDTFTVTFTKAGTYPYACVLHPQMVGTLEVRA